MEGFYKVIVSGSTKFHDYEFVKEKLDDLLSQREEKILIIEGEAPGVDQLAFQYAKERGYAHLGNPALWERYGKKAGPIRNKEMADFGADACVCFWHEESRGTTNMMNIAKKRGLDLRVIDITDKLKR